MGIRFNWKWVFPVHSLSASTSSTRQYLSPSASESEIFHKDFLEPHLYSMGAVKCIERSSPPATVSKVNMEMTGYFTGVSNLFESNSSHFSFLMEALDKVETIIDNSDSGRLEKDILTQIERLGALNLFHECLTRTLKSPAELHQVVPVDGKDSPAHVPCGIYKEKKIVHSVKKMERKSKGERAEQKTVKKPLTYSSIEITHQNKCIATKLSGMRSRRYAIAKNESDMSQGIKELANLEKIRTSMKQKLRNVSFSRWADTAGISEKELQLRLHFGWNCRDKLLRSTRSLVLYFAQNYQGQGLGMEDLIQAGNLGVIQGAERFDCTRGYQFSTYVQYWIRKSISTFVARNSRGIQLPEKLANAINKIKKARRVLYNLYKRNPKDEDIAKVAGVSFAYFRLASKYSRPVGSIEHSMEDVMGAKIVEVTPDMSLATSEEIIMRQHLRKEIHELLDGLHPREKQVLMLRFGLTGGRSKSLGEIGSLSNVTKQWIRKIEKAALAKLKKVDIQGRLKHFLYL